MNKAHLIFLCSIFFSSTLYTAADVAHFSSLHEQEEDSLACLVCGKIDNVFALCSEGDEHAAACPQCCGGLFYQYKEICTVCKNPLKALDTYPQEHKTAIDAYAYTAMLNKLSERIRLKRVIPIEGHLETLKSIIDNYTQELDKIKLKYFQNNYISQNQKTVNDTNKALDSAKNRIHSWNLIIGTINYHIGIHGEAESFKSTREVILKPCNTTDEREDVRLVASDTNRFQLFTEQLFMTLSKPEGHKEDIIPDIAKLAQLPPAIMETSF